MAQSQPYKCRYKARWETVISWFEDAMPLFMMSTPPPTLPPISILPRPPLPPPPPTPPLSAWPTPLPPTQQKQQPIKPPSSGTPTPEEILAEKRRRNAGASSRFRERRKQRERELQEKCQRLERQVEELQAALRNVNPDHPLLSVANTSTLDDRVAQLERWMTHEKEALEKENRYLRSLLENNNNNNIINNNSYSP